MTDQIQNLRTLINTLSFTEEEKIALQKYFIGNEIRQNDVLAFLPDYPTDDAKLVFLRTLISTPGTLHPHQGALMIPIRERDIFQVVNSGFWGGKSFIIH